MGAWRDSKKERLFSLVHGFEVKEDDDFIVSGYIATTHLDTGFMDEERGVWVRDHIAKETLERWAEEINSGNPRANKVSVHHDRQPHVTGVAVKGSAKVEPLGDGNYGLFTSTLLDKTKSAFDDTKYRIEKGFLDSHSIEFTTRNPLTGSYLEGAVKEEKKDGGIIRTLLPGTELEGYTLASQPMNPHAVLIKEILQRKSQSNKTTMEVKPMVDQSQVETIEQKGHPDEGESEAMMKRKKRMEMMKKEETLSDEDAKLLKETKERIALEAKQKEHADIVARLKEELKPLIESKEIENKGLRNTAEGIETKEFLQFKEAVKPNSNFSISGQFKAAAKLASTLPNMKDFKSKTVAEQRSYSFEIKQMGAKSIIESKGLGISTNQQTDADYLLSSAELSEVFDPVIYNALNQATTTWNLLEKDDLSGKGNNLVQFTLKTAANTSAAFYTDDAVALGNVTRRKFETRFKKCQVGVSVSGDMIAAARGGPIGDVFAKEVEDSTVDMMSEMNKAVFGTGAGGVDGLETDSGPIALEYVTDSATFTTLYNIARSAALRTSPDAAADTFINGSALRISLDNMRKAYEQCVVEGADPNRFVWVTHPRQVRFFKSIYDASQRPVPTSSRFGFEGRPEFDGVPIFEDKDCNNDDWFLIPLNEHRVGIWVPPTLELLGKDSDSQKGFIKAYYAIYNRRPRALVQIYNNATS